MIPWRADAPSSRGESSRRVPMLRALVCEKYITHIRCWRYRRCVTQQLLSKCRSWARKTRHNSIWPKNWSEMRSPSGWSIEAKWGQGTTAPTECTIFPKPITPPWQDGARNVSIPTRAPAHDVYSLLHLEVSLLHIVPTHWKCSWVLKCLWK